MNLDSCSPTFGKPAKAAAVNTEAIKAISNMPGIAAGPTAPAAASNKQDAENATNTSDNPIAAFKAASVSVLDARRCSI